MKTAEQPAPTGASLEEIVALAKRQIQIERHIEDLQSSLADLNEQLRKVSEEDLPLAMAEAKMQKFTLETGEVIEIKQDFVVGIPKERQEEAYNWLEKRKFGGMIKTEVKVAFGKGQLEPAKRFLAQMVGKGMAATLRRDVHHQTLKAWVTEQTLAEKPLPIPQELFGNHSINRAKVKLPKSER